MAIKKLVISGSARANSNTTKLIEKLFGKDIIHIALCTQQIAHYDYTSNYNDNDDFQYLVDQMLAAEMIILATPVYWYTMSGHMKIFMDRWTDLVTTHKDKGRALKGKKVALIVQASIEVMPEGFELPIKLTAEYMDMKYVGDLFWDSRNNLKNTLPLKNIVNEWSE